MPPSLTQGSVGANFRPVRKSDTIYKLWPTILTDILCNVKIPALSAVVCVRYGENEATTIIFMIDSERSPTKQIEQTKEWLRKLLDEKDLERVQITFLPGSIVRGASSTGAMNEEVLKVPAMMGQSIANKANTQTCGTLGGFLEVRYAESEWKTVALTCFHVVVPQMVPDRQHIIDHWAKNGICPKGGKGPDSLLQEWCDNGIRPDDINRKMLELCHPAQATMDDHLKMINENLDEIWNTDGYQQTAKEYAAGLGEYRGRGQKVRYQELKDEEDKFKAKKASYQKFLDNTGIDFGTVWAASGFRQGSAPVSSSAGEHLQYQLDWALIEVLDHRMPRVFQTPDGKRLSPLPPPPNLLNGLHSQIPVYFFGQRSEKGIGICHGLKCAANLEEANYVGPEVKTSLELIATGTGKSTQFALKGDSGSVVLAGNPVNPTVLGLVWAGEDYGRYTMFTHIDHLYADIKRLTGVSEVRIKR